MSPAAGVEIDALDLNQTNTAVMVRRQSPASHLHLFIATPADAPCCDRNGRPDVGRHLFFECDELRRRELADVEFDVTSLPPQMEGRRLPRPVVGRQGRDQVLRGMLLHMVKPSFPVKLEKGLSFLHGVGQIVDDLSLLSDRVFNLNAIEQSEVTRLSSSFGKENSVLQYREGVAGRPSDPDHTSPQLLLIGRSLKGEDVSVRHLSR